MTIIVPQKPIICLKMKAKLTIFLLLVSIASTASDTLFKRTIRNADYNVFMTLNLYEENVTVTGQEILGTCYGYLKKSTDSRVWLITDAKISVDGKKATIVMVNDYGSEDLVAELSAEADGTFRLLQKDGSTIKVAGKSKWIKLPKTLLFK